MVLCSSGIGAVIAVRMGPGQTALTLMPRGPSSTAIERVRPMTPCLATVYGLPPPVAPSASVDAILTTRPSPLRARSSTQARMRRACAVRLTARVSSHAFSHASWSIGAGAERPALLTRMSIGPRSARMRATSGGIAAPSARSTAYARASPPAASTSFATASTPAALRSTSARRAPASAKTYAVARPMPLAAPVMMATRPSMERLSLLSFVIRYPSSNSARGTPDCNALCRERASEVRRQRVHELLGREPRLLGTDQQCQILCHRARLDRLDADALERPGELDDVRRVVELAAVLEGARPGEDRGDRVRRRRLAALILAIVPRHRAVRGLRLDGAAVR